MGTDFIKGVSKREKKGSKQYYFNYGKCFLYFRNLHSEQMHSQYSLNTKKIEMY